MESTGLSLRQRKLLHFLQHRNQYITSRELAGHLNVSTRTIRNDISEINQTLLPLEISIKAKSSLGYCLEVANKDNLARLNQSSSNFLTREDRIRHIAFRLCLSDSPISLFDLEEEMFVSHTTLENDLESMKLKYIAPIPGMELIRSRNSIMITQLERKKRAILNRLFTENWNYNARGNAYYQYQYLEEEIVNLVMPETNHFLRLYGIVLEDINMVILNLSIAIMYYRVQHGHILTDTTVPDYNDSTAFHAANDLLDSIETLLSCHFPLAERYEIGLHISCSRLLDTSQINPGTISTYFDDVVISCANLYIESVKKTFRIDLSENEDFYIVLLQLLRYLKQPLHYFNDIQTQMDVTRSNLLISFEIAYIIQPIAITFYDRYFSYNELIYLAFIIEGAIKNLNYSSRKIRTVILCHLNSYSTWYLQQVILGKFGHCIHLNAMLPVYMKDNYDFSKIDLIITTANKEITSLPNCDTLLISPYFTDLDQKNLENLIFEKQLCLLYQTTHPSLYQLLSKAYWHEKTNFTDPESLICMLSDDFVQKNLVSDSFVDSILARESILTFAFQPSVVFVYSLVPGRKTQLSVATLNHRIKWNSYKIRTVIMAALHPEDTSFVFHIINDIFYSGLNLEDARFLKTKEELLHFFS